MIWFVTVLVLLSVYECTDATVKCEKHTDCGPYPPAPYYPALTECHCEKGYCQFQYTINTGEGRWDDCFNVAGPPAITPRPYSEQLALRGHYVKIWFINGGPSMVDNVQNVTYESVPISMKEFRPSLTFYENVGSLVQKIHPVLNIRFVWTVNESLFICSRFLAWHSKRLDELAEIRWDLIVAEEIPLNLCQRAITRYLGVPYVLINMMLPPALFHDGIDIPHQPAFYPTFSCNEATLKTFSQRRTNFLSHLLYISGNKITNMLTTTSRFYHYYTTNNFASKSLLSMTQWPTDFVYPHSHRLIYSTLECKKIEQLVPKWKKFVEEPKFNGTIVLSMGSGVFWSSAMLNSFFEVAEMLQNVSFVWHLRIPQSLPDLTLPNVRIGFWIPLDSLLAHNKTLVLVNQAGARSIYGAICTQVPILAIPIQFDQPRNSAIVAAMKIGIVLNQNIVTTASVLRNLSDLIHCNSYTVAIRKHRKMLLDTISPRGNITTFHLERAARRTFSLRLLHSKGGNCKCTNYFGVDVSVVAILSLMVTSSAVNILLYRY